MTAQRIAICEKCNFWASDMDQEMMRLLDIAPTCPRCDTKLKFVKIESTTVTLNRKQSKKDKPQTTEGEHW